MKDSQEFTFSTIRAAFRRLFDMACAAIGEGKTGRVIVEIHDGPTAEMRGKLHAMCDDLAEQVPTFKGAPMGDSHAERKRAWKAVCVSAAVADRFVPGYHGGLISVRPSSENLTKKQYCDAIEAAYAIGAESQVKWSVPAVQG